MYIDFCAPGPFAVVSLGNSVITVMQNLKRRSHFTGSNNAPRASSSVRVLASASPQPSQALQQASTRPKGVVIGSGWAGLGAAYAMTKVSVGRGAMDVNS